MRLVLLALVACGHPAPPPAPPPAPAPTPVAAADAAPTATDDEKLAAIQKAMNELDKAVQQCWAAAATERFDIAGELSAQIDIAPGTSHASVLRDTANNPKLAACVVDLLSGYRWAPPLYGQSIQLPFQFKAPSDGQNTIDRQLVPWKGQGKISVAVLLDEASSKNPAASMFEVAIAAGGTTGTRQTERTELWYFLGPATVSGKSVAAGDMVYVPPNGAREVAAAGADVHAVLVVVPGGREGSARAGALPTREIGAIKAGIAGPQILPAAKAKTYGPAQIFAEEKILAASILSLPAGANVAEHVHANETEMLYILDGTGTMTVAGTALAVTPTSVVQVPKNTKHAFAATTAVRAVQIYTPAGPEQRFKKAATK